MPKKILVVDDEQYILWMIGGHFLNEGYNVLTSIGGEEAWVAMTTQGYDLLILNDCMPKPDGIELLTRYQADEVLRQIPVVMLLDDVSDTQITRCRQCGVDCVLRKPLNKNDLLDFVNRLLEPPKDD